MGYDTSFKLKGELDSKFKSFFREDVKREDIQREKDILVALCMKGIDKSSSIEYRNAYKEISYALRMYMNYIEQDWKRNMEKCATNDKEINFCGWNHSRNSMAHTWESMDKIYEWFMSSIFLIAVTPCKSMFEDDTDYYKKHEELMNHIDDIEDIIWEFWDDEFIDFYRDSDLAIEEGDDTPTEFEDEEGEEENEDC